MKSLSSVSYITMGTHSDGCMLGDSASLTVAGENVVENLWCPREVHMERESHRHSHTCNITSIGTPYTYKTKQFTEWNANNQSNVVGVQVTDNPERSSSAQNGRLAFV